MWSVTSDQESEVCGSHSPKPRRVFAEIALYAAMLTFVSRWTAPLDKEALLAPMGAMFALTGMVLLLTATARNYATIRKLASVHYYRTYDHASHPPDWIERPARTFNNLLQVPTLFYIGCLTMMILARADQGALALAWIYVATRAVHAVLYIAWNPLAYRFGSFIASCICLGTLWARLIF